MVIEKQGIDLHFADKGSSLIHAMSFDFKKQDDSLNIHNYSQNAEENDIEDRDDNTDDGKDIAGFCHAVSIFVLFGEDRT